MVVKHKPLLTDAVYKRQRKPKGPSSMDNPETKTQKQCAQGKERHKQNVKHNKEI